MFQTSERVASGRSAGLTFSSLAPPSHPTRRALPGTAPRALPGRSSGSASAAPGEAGGRMRLSSVESYSGASLYDLLMTPHTLMGGSYRSGYGAAAGAGRADRFGDRAGAGAGGAYGGRTTTRTMPTERAKATSTAPSKPVPKASLAAQQFAQKRAEQMEHARQLREQREREKRLKEYASLGS